MSYLSYKDFAPERHAAPTWSTARDAVNGLPPPCSLEDHSTHSCCCNSHSTEYGNSHQALFCDLVVDEASQAARLKIRWFMVQKQIVVFSRFCVVSKLVITECQVIETFSSPFWCIPEYF